MKLDMKLVYNSQWQVCKILHPMSSVRYKLDLHFPQPDVCQPMKAVVSKKGPVIRRYMTAKMK